jgi:hypothetical protein
MLVTPSIRLTPTYPKHHKLDKTNVDKIVVHRLKLGLSILDAVDGFVSGEPKDLEAFRGMFPYHFGIERNGVCYQLLPLGRAGVHAKAWNSKSIAIACFGDFRHEQPTCDQWFACARLCRTLEHVFLGADVWGHDELPSGSSDPNKQCPGKHWPIAEFLGEVRHTPITGADIVDFERAAVF